MAALYNSETIKGVPLCARHCVAFCCCCFNLLIWEREGEKLDVLFNLFMPSLADSCTCPD